MANDHLREVQRLAETAAVQTEAVMRCERHNDVLLLNEHGPPEHVVYNVAANWVRDEVGMFLPEDLRGAIRSVLDRAARDGCPECAREV